MTDIQYTSLIKEANKYLDNKKSNNQNAFSTPQRGYVVLKETRHRPHSPLRAPAREKKPLKEFTSRERPRLSTNERRGRERKVGKDSPNIVTSQSKTRMEREADRFLRKGIPRVKHLVDKKKMGLETGRPKDSEFTIPRPKRVMTSQRSSSIHNDRPYDVTDTHAPVEVVNDVSVVKDFVEETGNGLKQVPPAPPPPPLPKSSTQG